MCLKSNPRDNNFWIKETEEAASKMELGASKKAQKNDRRKVKK